MILTKHKSLHLVLLMFFILVTTYLISSSISASRKLENLIVIIPAGGLVITLCIFVLFFIPDTSLEVGRNNESSTSNRLAIVDLFFIIVYGAFCFSLVYVGFDIATLAFIWIGTLLAGAKSKIISLIYALITTVIIVYTFKTLLPYPFPLLVLP